jgi:hypothetical protein
VFLGQVGQAAGGGGGGAPWPMGRRRRRRIQWTTDDGAGESGGGAAGGNAMASHLVFTFDFTFTLIFFNKNSPILIYSKNIEKYS